MSVGQSIDDPADRRSLTAEEPGEPVSNPRIHPVKTSRPRRLEPLDSAREPGLASARP
jgi:hypothetical protein